MDELEVLISEALQKFPSEDIRELVARETGLTVEEVSQKMNEAAKAAGDSFPAATFANIKVSGLELKQSYTPDLDGDGKSNTEADRKIGAQKVKEAIDTDNDNKITYKVAVVEDDIDLAYTQFKDLTFEEKTVKIGTSVADITPRGYAAYSSNTSREPNTEEYITVASDLDYNRGYYICYNSGYSHAGFHEVSYPSYTFVADGTVIILKKEY